MYIFCLLYHYFLLSKDLVFCFTPTHLNFYLFFFCFFEQHFVALFLKSIQDYYRVLLLLLLL